MEGRIKNLLREGQAGWGGGGVRLLGPEGQICDLVWVWGGGGGGGGSGDDSPHPHGTLEGEKIFLTRRDSNPLPANGGVYGGFKPRFRGF